MKIFTGILPQCRCACSLQDGPRWLLRTIFSVVAREKLMEDHQPRNTYLDAQAVWEDDICVPLRGSAHVCVS